MSNLNVFKKKRSRKRVERFWVWFQENEDDLFDYEKNQEIIFGKVENELRIIHKSLAFAFSQFHRDGKREFVISANGDKKAIPFVEILYESAPKLERWEFVKYRQRMDDEIKSFETNGIAISPDMVKFGLLLIKKKIYILFFVEGLEDKDKEEALQFGTLTMMDYLLGEYDVMTKIEGIDILPADEPFDGEKHPIKCLPKAFDDFVENIQLSGGVSSSMENKLDLEGWQYYFCCIDEKSASVCVDTSAANMVPRPGFCFFHTVRMDLQDPNPDGMPHGEEVEFLENIQAFAIPILEKHLQGIFVARVTTDERRDLFLYAKQETLDEDVMRRITQQFPAYTFYTGVIEDPEWREYITCFYPNEMGYHFILLNSTFDREIDWKAIPEEDIGAIHYLYFGKESDRARFNREFTWDGLTIIPGTMAGALAINGEYRACVKQQGSIDFHSVYNTCERLIVAAGEFGGVYSHSEIDSELMTKHYVSKQAMQRIAAEVEANVRPKSDLERFDVELK